jgi:hypothetical protein
MWARVKKALDPAGDGRYEVEYRVKQIDGSWRWLSAWGLVEFDGSAPDRKPVAIARMICSPSAAGRAPNCAKWWRERWSHLRSLRSIVQATRWRFRRNTLWRFP